MYLETIHELSSGTEATLVKVHSEKGTIFPRAQYKLTALFSKMPMPDSTRVLTFKTKSGTRLRVEDDGQIFPKTTLNSTIRIDHLKQSFNIRAAHEDEEFNAGVRQANSLGTAIKSIIEPSSHP